MSLLFQANHVSLLSDAYDTLIIQDHILEANGDPHSISGVIQSVVVMDKEKNTWLFTAPSWEYIVLAHGQHVHFEGPREYTEDGATFVCLRVSNSGGAQGFLTRQISSKAQLSYAKLMGEVREK